MMKGQPLDLLTYAEILLRFLHFLLFFYILALDGMEIRAILIFLVRSLNRGCSMQLSVETVVWVALALVVVAVVGLFLMGSIVTSSHQTSQKFYARLINSQYSQSYGGYIVSLRVVNTGEAGATLNSLDFSAQGFTYTGTGAIDGNLDHRFGDYRVTVNLPPGDSADISIGVRSNYVSGNKVLIVTAHFSNGRTSTITVDVP